MRGGLSNAWPSAWQTVRAQLIVIVYHYPLIGTLRSQLSKNPGAGGQKEQKLCSHCLRSLGPTRAKSGLETAARPAQEEAQGGGPGWLRRSWQQLEDTESGEDGLNKGLLRTLKGSIVLVEDC